MRGAAEKVDPSASARELYPRELCVETSEFLGEVYSPELALYPFSTSVVDGRYVNDYTAPWAQRYTINTLLGRVRAARAGVPGSPGLHDLRQELERFLAMYEPGLGPGDRGLLLVLLAELDANAGELEAALAAARSALDRVGVQRLNLQDLSWLVWGTACASAAEARTPPGFAESLHAALDDLAGSGPLARHVRSGPRRDIVSFGSTVYYLRALHARAGAFDDAGARRRFEDGVRTALSFQGPLGEWPWMISAARGFTLDAYPVYSVHQLGMAMLFLLPALDEGTVEGVDDAIRRSYVWALGKNELGIEFGRRDPFLMFRSIERDEPFSKLARFLRAGSRSALRRPAPATPARRTRINREWRSYECGWLLYAWADRPDELVL